MTDPHDHDHAITDPIPDVLAPGVHRLRSKEPTSEVVELMSRAGWAVRVVDVADAHDKAAIMDAFVAALDLPAWFGRNWDALADALKDLGWWPGGHRGRLLVIRGAGRLDTGTERDRAILLEVLHAATDSWAATATPLVVLLRR